MSGSELLQNSGNVTHLEATTKAQLEFEKYKAKSRDDFSKAELDFLDSIKKTQKQLEPKRGDE